MLSRAGANPALEATKLTHYDQEGAVGRKSAGLFSLTLALAVLPLLTAADPRLDEIKAQMQAVRAEYSKSERYRGSPLMEPVKRQLREWVADNLPAPGQPPDRIEAALNARLKAAGLFQQCGDQCDPFEQPASLGGITISKLAGLPDDLLVITSVNIPCGDDSSPYLFRYDGTGWRLRFASEQNDYRPGYYTPQSSLSVYAIRDSVRGDLMLTIGINPACMSIWQPLHGRYI